MTFVGVALERRRCMSARTITANSSITAPAIHPPTMLGASVLDADELCTSESGDVLDVPASVVCLLEPVTIISRDEGRTEAVSKTDVIVVRSSIEVAVGVDDVVIVDPSVVELVVVEDDGSTIDIVAWVVELLDCADACMTPDVTCKELVVMGNIEEAVVVAFKSGVDAVVVGGLVPETATWQKAPV